MEKYLYLFLNTFTILVPLIRSFEPKIGFYKKWKAFFMANIPIALAFILWDEYFTQSGIWGFNPQYLSGIYLGSLPLEECLFFITIPYASVFLYEVFNYFIKLELPSIANKLISLFLAGLNLSVAFSFPEKAYTFTALTVNGFLLIAFAFVFPSYLKGLFRAYLLVLPGFFLVNGVLTGTWIESEIVWYNNLENLGLRIGTIPVEDLFYGMSLIFLNLLLYQFFIRRQYKNQESNPEV